MKLTPQQKARLSRPHPFLFLLVIGLFCLPWLCLFGINLYLQQAQAQIDKQADAYFSRIDSYEGNASAEQIDQLSAKLGLLPNTTYAHPIEINREAALHYQGIEASLNQFLIEQTSKVSGPLDSLPIELQSYLTAQRDTLTAIQTYLLNHEAPRWSSDSELMALSDHKPMGFFNVRSIQKLLLLAALDAHHQRQPNDVFNALEASWNLNQSIKQRSDLSSQVLLSVISHQRASILRHLDDVPLHWHIRIQTQAQSQPILKGLIFENWLRYRTLQGTWIPTITPAKNAPISEKVRAALSNRFSAQGYFKLSAINTTQTTHQALEQLIQLDVCTTPQITAEQYLSDIHTARWNPKTIISPAVTAKRWQTAGMRSLSLELSQYILTIKQQRALSGKWPTTYPRQASQICPGEFWDYTLETNTFETDAPDDTPDTAHSNITISFSKQLLSPSAIPLKYSMRVQAQSLRTSR